MFTDILLLNSLTIKKWTAVPIILYFMIFMRSYISIQNVTERSTAHKKAIERLIGWAYWTCKSAVSNGIPVNPSKEKCIISLHAAIGSRLCDGELNMLPILPKQFLVIYAKLRLTLIGLTFTVSKQHYRAMHNA